MHKIDTIEVTSEDEIQLIESYRTLTGQGKEFINTTMKMAVNTFQTLVFPSWKLPHKKDPIHHSLTGKSV